MKIGAMLSDVSKSLFQQPMTERYPFERRPEPERLRSHLAWEPENCTGCGMCEKDCPARALEVHILDKKAKRFVLVFHRDRCTFCAQCVHTCMQGSLNMRHDLWELAALDKEPFKITFGEKADVECWLAGATAQSTAATADG